MTVTGNATVSLMADTATIWMGASTRKDSVAQAQSENDSIMTAVLAALLKGHDLATAVQWGAAHGILVQETPGDTTMVDERAVLAEVKRAVAGGGVKASR